MCLSLCYEAIGKKEKIKKKHYTSDLLEDIAKKTFKVVKEEEKEKQYTVNELPKEAQEAEGTKNKDTKKIRQEDRLEPEDEKAPDKRLNNKEEIDQERHRLEELAQRLVKEIKEKLI
ncbi:21888_t:CDS:2 [Gigaspora margarita]|uniref:21888_t:CDS:1 n=1 Tax=Gigaspora margarita TaxID=4874 RepID=A0ABN7UHP4_GIGMA|nr:21888_t:CDS:2 [Gigaspora margarita]